MRDAGTVSAAIVPSSRLTARGHGTSYDVLLAERVTDPLGLVDTAVEVVDASRRAQGHRRRGKPVPDWDMQSLPGMGALSRPSC